MATDDATYKRRTEVYSTKCLVTLPWWGNRPFPSSKKFHFQNEAKCEIFVVKMSFICIIIKNHFHINGFALSLALKVRFFGTRKWPNAGHPGRALAALASLHRNFTGAQGTGYFPDIFEKGDFFLRFQKNTHQHVAYSNRFCASLEKVVSLEATFLDVTLRDIQKTAARETM